MYACSVCSTKPSRCTREKERDKMKKKNGRNRDNAAEIRTNKQKRQSNRCKSAHETTIQNSIYERA